MTAKNDETVKVGQYNIKKEEYERTLNTWAAVTENYEDTDKLIRDAEKSILANIDTYTLINIEKER